MHPTITAFERSPDRGKGLARAIGGIHAQLNNLSSTPSSRDAECVV
jgi:hypothetical protein